MLSGAERRLRRGDRCGEFRPRAARAPRLSDWEDGPDAPDARIAGPRWSWPEGALVLCSSAGRPLALLSAGYGGEAEAENWLE